MTRPGIAGLIRVKTGNFPPGLNSSDFFDVYQIQSHMQMDSGEDEMKLMQTGAGGAETI